MVGKDNHKGVYGMQSNREIARFINVLDIIDKNGKRVPGLILSRPGFGKTSTLEKFCEYRGYNLQSIIPSQYSAEDILGIQAMDNGHLHRLAPVWYEELVEMSKNGKRNVLFIDELSATDKFTQAPLLNLIFNHDIGGRKLPENTLIIAAGNYPKDLDDAFSLLDPVLNRFVLLNLTNDMYSLEELCDNTFENCQDYNEFFGIDADAKHPFSFERFKNWVKSSKEVVLGCNKAFYDDNIGQLGFTTIRSVGYALAYAETYMKTYKDEGWARVCGDTMGTSAKREGIALTGVILSEIEKFVAPVEVKEVNLIDTAKALMKNLTDVALQDKLYEAFEKKSATKLRQVELSAVFEVMQKLKANSESANFGNQLELLIKDKVGV